MKVKPCTIVRLGFGLNEEYDKVTFKIDFLRHLPFKFVKDFKNITNGL